MIPAFPIVAQEPGTINDASEAPAKHVQQSANAREKEYGCDRKLNDVRDLINFIHEHLLSASGKPDTNQGASMNLIAYSMQTSSVDKQSRVPRTITRLLSAERQASRVRFSVRRYRQQLPY